MRALEPQAIANGVIMVNECGVDPGTDHMSAMKVLLSSLVLFPLLSLLFSLSELRRKFLIPSVPSILLFFSSDRFFLSSTMIYARCLAYPP